MLLRAWSYDSQQGKEIAKGNLTIFLAERAVVICNVTRTAGYTAITRSDQSKECEEVTKADLAIPVPGGSKIIGNISGTWGYRSVCKVVKLPDEISICVCACCKQTYLNCVLSEIRKCTKFNPHCPVVASIADE